MSTNEAPKVEALREAYVKSLVTEVTSSTGNSSSAWDELCGCANGGDPVARKYVKEFDSLFLAIHEAIQDAKV